MDGIVACETLYPEIPRLAPEAAVAYVPQWYHEFPIHAPESDRAHEILQAKIDALEKRDVDRILVVYHDPNAITDLQTDGVPLFVYRGRDCIELQLDREPTGPGEERKRGATYYLTRGWIDVAVDSYKVYKAYAGEIEELIEAFEEAQATIPRMRVSWPGSEKIQQARARSEQMQTDPAKLLRKVIESYQHLALVDTGQLKPFHYRYAEWFREFLGEIIPEEGNRDVEMEVVDGDQRELERVVKYPSSVPETVVLDPGERVPAEPGFRTGPQHS